MTDLSELLAAPKGESHVTAACGYREGARGGFVWHWRAGRVHTLKVNPPRCMTRSNEGGPWRSLLYPPFQLSRMLIELALDDDIARGDLTLADAPPSVRPLRRPYRAHRRAAMTAFFADVPEDVRTALQRFWTAGSFPLFRLLMTCPEARELMQSEDGARLAWCLANAHELRDLQNERHLLRRARRLARKKRIEGLGFVGLPKTSSALKALSKIPCEEIDSQLVRALGTVLHDPALAARASHVPVLNREVLSLLTVELAPYVHAALLHEVSKIAPTLEASPLPVVARALADTVELLKSMGRPVPVFASRAHLTHVHDAAVAEHETQEVWPTSSFPPLPITLSPRELTWLTPLTSSVALVNEGQAMHHCLGSLPSHHTGANAGTFFAFALTRPERLTLAITWNQRQGRWELYDLKGFANHAPDPDAMDIARELLSRFSLVIPGSNVVQLQLFSRDGTQRADQGGNASEQDRSVPPTFARLSLPHPLMRLGTELPTRCALGTAGEVTPNASRTR